MIAIVSYVDPLIPAAQYYYRLLQGVMLGFEELGLPVVFRRATEPYEECVANLRQDPALCGVIAIWSDPALSRQLAKLSIPVVLLDCEKPDAPLFDSVNQDGESGVYQATKYLINLGHREIGMMQATQLNCIGQRRFDGYKRALAESGIPFQLELVYPVVFWCDAAYASMRRILQGPRIPTAVVCASDVLALGVLAAANEAGLRVPRDLSVVGFGDEGYFTVPQLSTARVPVEQMGLNATRMLAERLKRPSAPLQQVNFPSEWISRGTCDCPALAPAGKAPEHSR
jgi:DNA-binding LacI/PurR family transcriptional regulator